MLKIQRPLCPELQFRLVHDISPDNLPGEEGDILAEFRKDQFILSCLSKAQNRSHGQSEVTARGGTITHVQDEVFDTVVKTKCQTRNNLEQLNNEINLLHHGVPDLKKNEINEYRNSVTKLSKEVTESEEYFKGAAPSSSHGGHVNKIPRRPRKLPEIPSCQTETPRASNPSSETSDSEGKCLADELLEALAREDGDDDVFLPKSQTVPVPVCRSQYSTSETKVYPKYSSRYIDELRGYKSNTVSKNTKSFSSSDNHYLVEDSTSASQTQLLSAAAGGDRNDNFDGEGRRRRTSSCSSASSNISNMEVTHRGMHRFIPRHADEIVIEIGDPIHVSRTGDDLWCEGVNLKTGQKGIFPSMYATDLDFLEEDSDDDGCVKFHLSFLGSVEMNYHKGNEVLCQAINKVALQRRSTLNSLPPPLCTLEVSEYGIRMIDKSKDAHESDQFTHFFALKNITFCGYHPRNERYFAFITKHPHQYRYACHVFLGDKTTRSVSEALGQAFQRLAREFMAFTHQTEDIYLE